jgi:hypothetical protein
MELRHQRLANAACAAAASMQSPPPQPTVERAVQRLDNDAEAISAMMHASDAMPTSVASQFAQVRKTGGAISSAIDALMTVPTQADRGLAEIGDLHGAVLVQLGHGATPALGAHPRSSAGLC